MGERVDIRPGASSADPSPPPIDYGRRDSFGDRMRGVRAFFTERFDGVLKFFGELIAILGGARRAGLCASLACLSGGLGECLRAGTSGGAWGVFWMTVGGFGLGLCLPLPRK